MCYMYLLVCLYVHHKYGFNEIRVSGGSFIIFLYIILDLHQEKVHHWKELEILV
jgi:hypothetical protein